ncbi:uncharacterized protein LOC105426889 [Pogonomyrmex barbatus]|uniref:Uncharacterized protein LOC105426889 n=1 Tax=Pogonomyrmex barbatus TaxID=144034 RepID=A0A6I9W400_9HYME|nr:uncharacterized protein LOC105426889 [Pogonomyrmex barbatus]
MIKRTWLIRYFAFNEYDDKVKCIRCKRELKIFIGISRLKYHLKSCHEGNEGNDVDIMVQQSVNEKDNASTSSHQVELYSQTIDEERQRFYATVQQQQIVKGTESKQVLQSNTTLNNDSYFLNALTFCDSTEHLKSNDEINISTANILMQQSLNEAHNVNSRSNHVGTHSEAIENEDKRFHHETILNQQTAMMISEEIL